jgi:hypothetical protein
VGEREEIHKDFLWDNLKDNNFRKTCAQIGDQYENGSYRNRMGVLDWIKMSVDRKKEAGCCE